MWYDPASFDLVSLCFREQVIPNWGRIFQYRPDYPGVEMEQLGLRNTRTLELFLKSRVSGSILTKFGTLVQNETPMTKIRPKTKPEVVFQHCGRPFSETGSRFPTLCPLSWKSIWRHKSSANRPIMTKFGRQMQNDMPMTTCRLSLIHIWRCRRSTLCRSRWSPYH